MLQEPRHDRDLFALQQAIYRWSTHTFHYDRPASAVLLAHFGRETKEIIVDPGDKREYADALILLLGAIAYSEFTFEEIEDDAWVKHGINEGRSWNTPDPETGIIEHQGERSESAANRIVAAVRSVDGIPTKVLRDGRIKELLDAAKMIEGRLKAMLATPGIERHWELALSRFIVALSHF